MTLHMPTHPSQAAHPHVFRNLFAAILIAIVAVLVVYAVTTTDLRSTTTPAPALTEMERMVEFRAGERAPLAVPSEAERMVEFRAGERAGQ